HVHRHDRRYAAVLSRASDGRCGHLERQFERSRSARCVEHEPQFELEILCERIARSREFGHAIGELEAFAKPTQLYPFGHIDTESYSDRIAPAIVVAYAVACGDVLVATPDVVGRQRGRSWLLEDFES